MAGISLRLKSLLVGSPIETLAQEFRWLASFPNRHKHPELWEVYLEERRLPLVLRKLLKTNSDVVDVGCHIGSFLSLLRTVAPRGKHIGIEASKIKGEWLRSKFPTMEIHNVAVGDTPGRATFEENVSLPGYSRLLSDQKQAGNIYYDVEVRRLDDLLTRKMDLLKLDIEGGELAALKGATAILDTWRPPILFEWGSEYVPDKPSRTELFDFLSKRRYGIYSFGDFLFEKGPMGFDEFRRCGLYPFRAFNFLAIPDHPSYSDGNSL